MGDPKPKKQEASTTKSAYNGINNYTVDTGFGSSNAMLDGKNLTVRNNLTAPIQQATNQAQQGLLSGANYFAQDPTVRAQELFAGNNPYYNVFKAQSDRNFNDSLGSLQAQFTRNGLGNSTIFGGALGQAVNDRILTDNQNALAALDFQNQQANQALQANMGIYGGISDISGVPLSMASGNLQTGFGSRDQVGMFNAGQLQNMAQFNEQQRQQAAARRSGFWGNIIGAAITGAGSAATGGMR